MNYEQLLTDIRAAIRPNGENEITGQIMQDVLVRIVEDLASCDTYGGVIGITTVPDTDKPHTFFLLGEVGTYSNLGGIEHEGGIGIALWDGVSWDYENVPISAVIETDATPTEGSTNPVQSGGVYNELALGAVYDVSAKNPTAGSNNDGKFESLSALLSDANLNTLIPIAVRKGGMSIKFAQTFDNKYVQYRLMLSEFTAATFANVANWQGVDDEPTIGSNNLVKSGGVYSEVDMINSTFGKKLTDWGYFINNTETGQITSAVHSMNGYLVKVTPETKYLLTGTLSIELHESGCYSGTPSENTYLGLCTYSGNTITTLPGTEYIVINKYISHNGHCIYGVETLSQSNLKNQESFVVCNSDTSVLNKQIAYNENTINKDVFFCKFTHGHSADGNATLLIVDSIRGNISAPLYYNGTPLSSNNHYDAGDIVLISYNRSDSRFDCYSLSKIHKLIAAGAIDSSKIAAGAIIKEKMGYEPLDNINDYFGRPQNIIIGLSGADGQILQTIQSFIKDVTVLNEPDGYTKGCIRVRQIYCVAKYPTYYKLFIQLGIVKSGSNTLSNIEDLGEISINANTKDLIYRETASYRVAIDLNNWALKDLFTHATAYFYNNSKNNPYSIIPTNDIVYINGKTISSDSIDEEKLSEEVREKINNTGVAKGFLYGKKVVTLCDSMGAGSNWQTKLAELTGCIYDKQLNDNHYSVGGTKTLYASQMGNDGQGRAIKLVEEGLIEPDVIIYENVNDSDGLQRGTDADEPFMKSQQLMFDISPRSSENDAITYWNDNFANIVGNYTPQTGTIIGIPFAVNNGVKLKITSSAVADGNFSINLTQAGNLSIAVSAGESISSIISKILEYDWNGYVDAADPNDNEAVIFTKIDGTNPAIFSVNAGTTGITYSQETGIAGVLYVWKYFYGHDLSKWTDNTYWKDSITMWSMWKGIIEYLQVHFPKAIIYWMEPATFSFDYNNLSAECLFPDGTPNYYYIWTHKITYSQIRSYQKAFCDAYHIPWIDLINMTGINPMNASYFCNANNVHPKQVAYDRWAEILAQQIN